MTENPYEPPQTTQGSVRSSGSVLLGIVLACVLHGVAVGVSCAFTALFLDVAETGLVPFLFVGVTQVVYLGPAALFAFSMKRHRTLTGIAIAAAVTFLLNAACFGVLLLGFSGF